MGLREGSKETIKFVIWPPFGILVVMIVLGTIAFGFWGGVVASLFWLAMVILAAER